MRKGGEIASLLEQTASDIRNLKVLKKEISAQVGMYTIFIFITIGIAAPLLFAFSFHLVETMIKIGSNIDVNDSFGYASVGPINFKGIGGISTSFLRGFSIATLTIASFFGSLLLGLLQEGKEKAGIKYIPILLSLNMAIYFLAKLILSNLLGSITPGAIF
jgi:archaellum biogenesis protein FlaJ (TadC family)